jgi:UDP-3-O-[3-hydroxymyristoyl] glucosamine N-acyltransferase
MRLGELVGQLGGTLVKGSPEWDVDFVNLPSQARPFDLVFAEDSAAAIKALESNAGTVVLRKGLVDSYERGTCVVEADQPKLWFALAAKLLKPVDKTPGIHPAAVLGKHVELGDGVSIGPCAVLGDHVKIGTGSRVEAGASIGRGVEIGEFCRVYPRVVIYPRTTLGNWVIVHAGAVLGADGFGYVRDPKSGAYTQFPQQGTLVIEDDVEIGANCTIDRGALGETRIRRGAKFDNMVHIAHNCDIGEDVVIAAQTGISGSSTVGDCAVIAGQVGIGDHVHVGPGVILGGQAGVFSGKTVTNEGLKPGTVHWGTPARPLQQVLREQATLARLARRQGPSDRGDKGKREKEDRGAKE